MSVRFYKRILDLLSAAQTYCVSDLCTGGCNGVSILEVVSEMYAEQLRIDPCYRVVGEVVCRKGYVAYAVFLAVNSRHAFNTALLDVPYDNVVGVLVFAESVGELYRAFPPRSSTSPLFTVKL